MGALIECCYGLFFNPSEEQELRKDNSLTNRNHKLSKFKPPIIKK